MNTDMLIKSGIRVAVLLALIFVLLFLLSFTGVVKCNQVPVVGGAWCQVYWDIKTFFTGAPKVLIVYGDAGLGNPIGPEPGSLEQLLSDPKILGVHPDTMHINRVNLGNLRGYDLVIVEKARRIETKQLRAFIDFVTQPTGGKLIWTGDAGTELGPDDTYLYTTDKNPDDDVNKIIGPWARRDEDFMILFDELLGVRMISTDHITFCELNPCPSDRPFFAGNLETEPSGLHPLIRGLSRTLPLYAFKGQDFAVVETLSGGIVTEVLSLDFGSGMGMVYDETGTARYDVNESVPLIVTSGIGERVIYYAMPPEYFANPRLLEFGKGTYLLPLENMYYGTLKG